MCRLCTCPVPEQIAAYLQYFSDDELSDHFFHEPPPKLPFYERLTADDLEQHKCSGDKSRDLLVREEGINLPDNVTL